MFMYTIFIELSVQGLFQLLSVQGLFQYSSCYVCSRDSNLHYRFIVTTGSTAVFYGPKSMSCT